ncbi:MAG TPA: deoxyribodipyrimidine photo-lyase [Polyangiaceae bacterium]|nr:deoxyribodipyrimidine photo-lyase [Polyangiaceae bacterium]
MAGKSPAKRERRHERSLVWFRGKDLRVSDHAPLTDALARGEVVPLFVLDPYFFEPQRARELPHRMQFLLESLAALQGNIAHLGSELLLAAGKSVDVVPELAERFGCTRVVAQRWTEPFARERDRRVAAALSVPFERFEGETLAAPETVRNGSGQPFSVFTPFARALRRNLPKLEPLKPPRRLPPLPADIQHRSPTLPTLAQLGIDENPRLLRGGERKARARLAAFIANGAEHYDRDRDRMDVPGTSRLSADLKFGTLSIKTVWAALNELEVTAPRAVETFRNELTWREFTHATLWDRPWLLREPFRDDFAGFPYAEDAAGWQAWVSGHTGYPVVDAAARQLLSEGFVHNRARMIAASFLTKHQLIHYAQGEAHYMKYLTDGDWAQNNAGWQWSAGCGTDAQPYFRVFNPTLQGEKFDPQGDYVRRYVPELARLPAKYIHRPAEAPAQVLAEAGVVLGETYPEPIVDHAVARDRFLKIAESHLKGARSERRR